MSEHAVTDDFVAGVALGVWDQYEDELGEPGESIGLYGVALKVMERVTGNTDDDDVLRLVHLELESLSERLGGALRSDGYTWCVVCDCDVDDPACDHDMADDE